jgi:2-hydroxychromene-2-carboxylate isomerase
MSEPIHFYYDFISPYSYFAFAQREEIRARTGQELLLKPVCVGDIMKEVGNVPTSITCKAKRVYLGQDVARWAQKLRVPVQSHAKFGTFSTAPLIKAAIRAGDDVEAFSLAAFAAMTQWFAAKAQRFATYWTERETMTDTLAERVAEAVGHGAFGVPHFHTDRGDFFGNDRIEFLVEAFSA